jgi:type I restriction enzyme S subunit
MEKQMNKPQLRFPEFKEEWGKKKLREMAETKVTNSFSRENLNYETGEVKNIHYGDIHTKFQTLFKIEKENVPFINSEISIKRIANENYCIEGDLIFADASEDLNDVGKSIEIMNLNRQKLLSGLHTILVRPYQNTFQNGFAGYLFKSNNVRIQIQKESQGSKVLSISVGRLLNTDLNFPTLPEQTKIANFLTAVDEKLQALKKKKALLEQYKKGVMQKLFPLELKFKDEDGNEFPEWEEKKLGKVTLKVDKKNKSKEILPVYSISNINGFVPQSEQFDGVDSNERGYDISLYKIVEKETFAYNPARINVGSIGYNGNLKKVIVSSLYVCFKTIESVNDLFFNYYLKTIHFNNSVLRNGEGGVRIYLFYENFSEITINLPSLPEQTLIANFLSAIEDKIKQNDTQIQKIEQWKKGLLQKMFI